MTAGIVRIVRKLPSSPNTSARATLTKKARAAGVKSNTISERKWKFQSDIRMAIVICLKGRIGRSRIDRVKINLFSKFIGAFGLIASLCYSPISPDGHRWFNNSEWVLAF
ncbi:hypothetical protein AVEN_144949-1 [Araneus ventricosus]|uniref:Uncharacterized protein n=1 Tax=Araneus ventricosus TaxID=182803 RepID=A0A4Y2MTS1_ARAVE|nr:hypothetical protein AVEN_144949-1 [Araneus ventricosus]